MEVSNEDDASSDAADNNGFGTGIDDHAMTAAERAELIQLREKVPALNDQVEVLKKKIEWYEQ